MLRLQKHWLPVRSRWNCNVVFNELAYSAGVRYNALTGVIMNRSICWDTAPRGPSKTRRFGGTCHLK
jgi:hypothetical protein